MPKMMRKDARNKAREANGLMPKATEMNMRRGAAKTNKLVFFLDSIVTNCSSRHEGHFIPSPSVHSLHTVCAHVHNTPQFSHFGIILLPFPYVTYTYALNGNKFPKSSHYFIFFGFFLSWTAKKHCPVASNASLFPIGILFRFSSCCELYRSAAPCFRSVHASVPKMGARKVSRPRFHTARRP